MKSHWKKIIQRIEELTNYQEGVNTIHFLDMENLVLDIKDAKAQDKLSPYTRWRKKIEDYFKSRANVTDVAELHRLTIRMARRCARDLKHAADCIAENELQKEIKARASQWEKIFWNTRDYRDELHQTIQELEYQNKLLKKQLADNNVGNPDMPF